MLCAKCFKAASTDQVRDISFGIMNSPSLVKITRLQNYSVEGNFGQMHRITVVKGVCLGWGLGYKKNNWPQKCTCTCLEQCNSSI